MAKVNNKIKKTLNVKQKSLRMSAHLQERVVQQILADNVPAVSQPAQSEPLDVVSTSSTVYNYKLYKVRLYFMVFGLLLL